MVALSIHDINALPVYPVRLDNTGEYLFMTESGTVYAIGFLEDQEIAGCTTYQFTIGRRVNAKKGSDQKVRATIMAILAEFFRKNTDILLYICDTSDKKEASRNRLFLQWFYEADDSADYVLRAANAVVEGEGIYFAIIVPKKHPKLQAICEEFDRDAFALTQKPE